MSQSATVQALDAHMKYPNNSGLTPLGHAVLILPCEDDLKTEFIAIPDTVKRNVMIANQECIVIAVGPNAWDGEPTARAKPGDRVLVTQYTGYTTTTTADKRMYRLVNDRDIFCRIDWR